MAIGNPLGLERSVSLGVVSALFRELPTRDGILEGLIQTDAAREPGTPRAGSLLDMDGRVVGINTAMLTPARGIGFAVPGATASWWRRCSSSTARCDGRISASARQRGAGAGAGPRRGTGARRARRRRRAGHAGAAGGLSGGDLPAGRPTAPVSTLDDLARVRCAGAGRPRWTSRSSAGYAPSLRGETRARSGLTQLVPARRTLCWLVHAARLGIDFGTTHTVAALVDRGNYPVVS